MDKTPYQKRMSDLIQYVGVYGICMGAYLWFADVVHVGLIVFISTIALALFIAAGVHVICESIIERLK